LTPFDAFDHLQVLPLPGCLQSAVGVGAFANSPAGVPRQLEQIVFQGTTYVVTEIPTDFDVITLSVVIGPNGDVIVGFLGSKGSSTLFGAFRITDCNQWMSLGNITTDFAWRTPSVHVSKTDGVQLLGLREADLVTGSSRYRFLHYDGYDVRSWEVEVTNAQPPTGSLSFRQVPIHADRSDVSF
jgi:hypothetical protein